MQIKFKLGALILGCGLAASVHAQTWTWTGCPDVTQNDFKMTTLIRNGSPPDANLAEPIHMAFDMDAQGHVDIYYVERGHGTGTMTTVAGDVKRYLAASNTVQTLITLPTFRGPLTGSGSINSNLEDGATGIALDPNFKTNGYVYVYYSPAAKSVFRISRFTLANNTLGAEKIILEIPEQREYCCHTGGAMAFDDYGDLWIGVGANTGTDGGTSQGINESDKDESEEWGASDTHGLRGSILRIHPDSSARGYSIPPGNFGDYFYQQTGNTQYADTSKVAPEVYLKGERNPYSLQLDPVRRWVLWGDVGPDGYGTHTEEYDLATKPGFMGWPYFAGRDPSGNNIVLAGNKNPAAPTNTSKWNTGLPTLPPAQPAIYGYNQSCAITGPLYRYDGDLQDSIKFPPHFTRKWFVADWSSSQMQVLTPDSTGQSLIGSAQRIFSNFNFYAPLDVQMGPDGAMYVINYGSAGYFAFDQNTSIVKITYTGTCHPATPKLETPTGLYLNPATHYVTRPTGWVVNLGANAPVLVPSGMQAFEVFDLMGRKVWEKRNLRPGESFSFPASMQHGALQYRWIPE